MLTIIICFILAYLLGSIPSGVWLGKLFYKIDLRDYGSGNMGTTNAFRVLGPKMGIAVFLLDMLKGSLATLIPIWLGVSLHPIFFGAVALIGHTYPIFAKFKGGKAVATSAGVGMALYPLFLIGMLVIFGLTLYLSSMVSLASLTAIFAAFILSFFLNDPVFTFFIFIAFLFILYRHRENIRRIRQGSENKVNFGLRKDAKNKDKK